jgi:cystathionine beta-lyase/cystathionine gamma-synthase
MLQFMKFPFFDLTRQFTPLKAEVMAKFEELVTKQTLIGGPAVENFEKDMAKWMNVKHAIVVASGTDALIVGLKALGVGVGDEVITPAYSFFASVPDATTIACFTFIHLAMSFSKFSTAGPPINVCFVTSSSNLAITSALRGVN